jgi:hypothetical protein
VIIPIVKVLDWDSPEHTLITISGKDQLGINDRSENGAICVSSSQAIYLSTDMIG